MPTRQTWCILAQRYLIFFCIAYFISSSYLHAQQKSKPALSEVSEWTLDATVNGVSFYHSAVTCNGKKMVLLKMHNANSHRVDAAWHPSFEDLLPQNGTQKAVPKKFTLQTGEVVAGNCSNAVYKDLVVDPIEVIPTHAVDIKSFAFKQISVNRSF